jgi:hypothetical protein
VADMRRCNIHTHALFRHFVRPEFGFSVCRRLSQV